MGRLPSLALAVSKVKLKEVSMSLPETKSPIINFKQPSCIYYFIQWRVGSGGLKMPDPLKNPEVKDVATKESGKWFASIVIPDTVKAVCQKSLLWHC